MATALDELLALLDLEPIELNLFRGRSPEEDRQRVFGGQVLAQALAAATRTVEGRLAHSLHAYFLRAGDPTTPILYEVDRIRDGRSFTTRRVVAIQHGQAIFNMSASFQDDEKGFEHQAPMPEAPRPDELPTPAERADAMRADAPPEALAWFDGDRPIDERSADPIDYFRPVVQEPYQRVWLRANGRLPDEPWLHQVLLAYASDLTLLDTSAMPHAISFFDDAMQIASLDHAIWFHRPFRADDWMLHVSDSPSASGSRGFNRASVYTADGVLAASVAQEGLLRAHR